MNPARAGLLLLLFAAPRAAAGQEHAPSAALFDAVGVERAQATWSASLDVYLYLQQDDNLLMPILDADRGALHLEGRYQYEDLETVSGWVGWGFEIGESLQLELVPMAGVIIGRTRGMAPALEVTLSWKSLELYSESEYVFDFEGVEGDYFYSWSELSWQGWPWLRLGLSAQRTRSYRSEREIERGLFVGVSRGPVELTVYGWNLDGEARYAVCALGVDF